MVTNTPSGGIRRIIGFVFLVGAIAVIAIVVLSHAPTVGNSSTSVSDTSTANTSLTIPQDEQRFIDIVSAAQADSQHTDNDMQKGGVKAKRDSLLCSSISANGISDWVGKIEKIDSNSDGKGVFSVTVAPDVIVTTWNNALSDIGSDTLIEPGSQVFESASAMKTGQIVEFSGTFLRGSEGDCFEESSLTLDGKIRDPDFIFRFSKVTQYDPAQHNTGGAVRDVIPQRSEVPTPVENFSQSVPQTETSRGSEPPPVENFGTSAHLEENAEFNQRPLDIQSQERDSDLIRRLDQSCGVGDSDSCFRLGVIFELGHGVVEDFSRARELYLKACEKGDRRACDDLGILQNYEPDLQQCRSADAAVTVSHFKDDCDAGNGASCTTLGHLLIYGCGVPKNAEEARQAYEKACKIGNKQGCERQAEMQ